MSTQARLNKPAVLLLIGMLTAAAAFSLVVISGEMEGTDRPNGLVVWGGALVLGLVLGGVLEYSGILRRDGRGSNARVGMTIGSVMGAAGLALIIRSLVPEVAGWSIGLLAPALLVGFLLPIIGGSLWREYRRDHSRD